MNTRSICIATVTRNRPLMLRNLYHSLSNIADIQEYRISFLIVENNQTATLHDVVQDIINTCNLRLEYIVENDIGISFARNRAIEYAIANRHDFLIFVDDDEFVDPDWLANLLARQEKSDLDLVGSLVLPKPFSDDLTWQQCLVWRSIECHSARTETRHRKLCEQGLDHRIKIATGSWLGRIAFFEETGLRFDTGLGLSGGEDWKLFHEAQAQGAKTGWAPDAIVYETVPATRLKFSYQFKRNRDHANTQFWLLYRRNPRKALLKWPLYFIIRSLKFLLAVLAIPFTGGRSILSASKSLGAIIGLIDCLKGHRTHHYNTIYGN
ncbi:glycosyltransferase [Daeguia caeni]|uniref:Glycosyltransferase n=1 Tax=Daeguia caeni TaxID=439612 RepID=A0ABV9H7F9_9HYPH